MEKTLFVSDLDGTLLNSNEEVSEYSAGVINSLVEKGMVFSYATARSGITASRVTEKITVGLPVIVYNGTFILDSISGQMLFANFFSRESVFEIKEIMENDSVYPIVYSYLNGAEKFSYVPEKLNEGTAEFLATRSGDIRDNPISSANHLYDGNVFYVTCIDDADKLLAIYKKLKSKYSCCYHRDIYSHRLWLEIMPQNVSKAEAALRLKKLLGCNRIVAFGDAKNDIPMFKIADECYAVSNAAQELKAIATDIIKSNNENGVAEWLLKHYK